MEDSIRYNINKLYNTRYQPETYEDKAYNIRGNVDGADKNWLLEIKCSTSKEVQPYYLYQLMFYMVTGNYNIGTLAIYHNDETGDYTFDESKLTLHEYTPYTLCEKLGWESASRVYDEVERFWNDVERAAKIYTDTGQLNEWDLYQDNELIIYKEATTITDLLNTEQELKQNIREAKKELQAKMQYFNVVSIKNDEVAVRLVQDKQTKKLRPEVLDDLLHYYWARELSEECTFEYYLQQVYETKDVEPHLTIRRKK
jgi:predicted GIY-YIG superfamily endonuclease